MKTAIKIVAALFVVLALAAGAAFLFVPDDMLRALPGGQGETLVSTKHRTREDLSHWADGVAYSAKSLWWDVSSGRAFDTSPQAVIEIPRAVREQIAKARATPPKTPVKPAAKMAPSAKVAAASLPANTKPATAPATAPMVAIQKEPSPKTPVMAPAAAAISMAEKKTSTAVEMASKAPPPPPSAEPPPPVKEMMAATPKSMKPEAGKAALENSAKAPPSMATAKTVAKKIPKKPVQTASLGSAEPVKQAVPKMTPPPPPPPPTPDPAAKPKAAPAKPAVPAKAAADDGGETEHKRGLLYYKGTTVPKNFRTAADWFRKAAVKKHAGAQYNLGIMAYLGQGMDQSFAEAAKWFRLAGEQDHASAQYNLGFLFYEGKGVAKDDLSAYTWIDRAARLGDEKAKKARDTLKKVLPPDIFQK